MVVVVVVVVATFVARASAQPAPAEPDATGVELGVRAGYALPAGDREGMQPLGRTAEGAVPLTLDVGYRVTPNLFVGALLSYAFLRLDKVALFCDRQPVDGPADCSGTAIRIAADARWQVPLGGSYAAWVEAGAGLEWMTIHYEPGGFSPNPSDVDYRGFELAHLEVGAGSRIASRLVAGPFASAGLGQFRTTQITGQTSRELTDKTLHGWVTFGVRAMYTAP